ncbi:MAG: HAMP domain-containing histidine kinase [Candidatus Eremiobacteraeota bacterium]|nr:HAMP domain-containing histidine kinase [Candidatus Eremiobacteraeota bacterium]
MKFRRSLRFQLVAWYVAISVIVALAISALGAVVTFETTLERIRVDITKAAQRVRVYAAQFHGKQHSPGELESYLAGRLASNSFEVRVIPNPPTLLALHQEMHGIFALRDPAPFTPVGQKQRFIAYGPQLRRGPPNGMAMPFGFLRDPLLRPEHVSVGAGEVLLFPSALVVRTAMDRYFFFDAAFFILAMSLAWFAANTVARKTLDPLEKTTRALQRFASGDFTPEPVRTSDKTELGELARAYNGAVEQITHAFEERARGDAEMRQFVADAGHQLRTPLTVIMGHLSAFASKAQTPREETVFTSMLAQSRRMKALIADLITLARLEHEDESHEVLDVSMLVRQAVDPYAKSGERRVQFRSDGQNALVRMRAEDLVGAVSALIDNALKYAPSGPVEVSVGVSEGSCRICVDDSGPGMTEFEIAKAFDRFFRGESGATVEGTGLGLAIVKRSVERCGGSVTVRNRVPGGLSCCIVLPALTDESEDPASAVSGA